MEYLLGTSARVIQILTSIANWREQAKSLLGIKRALDWFSKEWEETVQAIESLGLRWSEFERRGPAKMVAAGELLQLRKWLQPCRLSFKFACFSCANAKSRPVRRRCINSPSYPAQLIDRLAWRK